MVAVDSEVKAVTVEEVVAVVVAAVVAVVAVAATETSKIRSPGNGTRCIANSNSRICTSPCNRENPRLPHHCHGLSCRAIVTV